MVLYRILSVTIVWRLMQSTETVTHLRVSQRTTMKNRTREGGIVGSFKNRR